VGKIPEGICQCGCGQYTNIVKSDERKTGLKKGQYRHYVKGHYKRNPHKLEHGIELKRCCTCKQWKPLKEYNKSTNAKDGFNPRCRDCNRQYYIDNQDKILNQKKQYTKDNTLQRRMKGRDHYRRTKQSLRYYYQKIEALRKKAQLVFGNRCIICHKELFRSKRDYRIHHLGEGNEHAGYALFHPESWNHCTLLCANCHDALHNIIHLDIYQLMKLARLAREFESYNGSLKQEVNSKKEIIHVGRINASSGSPIST
jgi:hypothetical protein